MDAIMWPDAPQTLSKSWQAIKNELEKSANSVSFWSRPK